MPEGDTLFRTATVLRRALLGSVVVEARARPSPFLRRVPDLSGLNGLPITAVESLGKHLLIAFGQGRQRRTLRTHLRMTGSWHRYRVGEPWRLPERRAAVVLRTEAAVAVCFDCPTVELLTEAGVRRSPALRGLGPDLLAPDVELETAVTNFRQRGGDSDIGDALIDQGNVAGIGNVVRNEALFIERISPWRRLSDLGDEDLHRLLATSQRVLRANVGGGGRTTTGDPRPGARLWVYSRAGQPCRRCGTHIELKRQGSLARATYWCPSCQE